MSLNGPQGTQRSREISRQLAGLGGHDGVVAASDPTRSRLLVAFISVIESLAATRLYDRRGSFTEPIIISTTDALANRVCLICNQKPKNR
jgi:phosphoribosyl-dephospho-CoA transferase